VCCILFLFYIQQIEAQKDKYGFIMDKVRERVYENYDSMMYTYSNYAEYAYIDSSKELLGTLYNGIDCFLLKAITQSMFVFDGRSDKHFEDKYLNKKRMTGNWDTCYQRTVVTDIVNKTDYAVLLFSRSADCFRIVGSQDR
jgi:hypothetical protein